MPRIHLDEDIRPLSEFRADAAGLLERLRETKRALVLTQRGHSTAVVLHVGDYQRLVDELDLLRDIHAAVEQIERGEGIPHRKARTAARARLRG